MPEQNLSTQVLNNQPTVLFADIAGWTELCGRVGNALAKPLADALFERLRRLVKECSGWVVNRIGDEFMCVFDTPDDAALAAIAMQRCADTRNRGADEKLLLRIGFHCGPVLFEHDDVVGDTVNLAARVASEAGAGRIVATRAAAGRFSKALAHRVKPWRAAAIEGKADAIELIEVEWDVRGGGTVLAGEDDVLARTTNRVVIRYQGTECTIERSGRPIRFGRGSENDLVIPDPTSCVSGNHGSIGFRDGAPEVVDTSRNGIYMSFEGAASFRVDKRAVLRASGRMTLGRTQNDPAAIAIEFQLE